MDKKQSKLEKLYFACKTLINDYYETDNPFISYDIEEIESIIFDIENIDEHNIRAVNTDD